MPTGVTVTCKGECPKLRFWVAVKELKLSYHDGYTAPGKELNTEKLVAHPAPKPSATKSFQKIPSAGIGARKVSSY